MYGEVGADDLQRIEWASDGLRHILGQNLAQDGASAQSLSRGKTAAILQTCDSKTGGEECSGIAWYSRSCGAARLLLLLITRYGMAGHGEEKQDKDPPIPESEIHWHYR
jgi:hypothetical protein